MGRLCGCDNYTPGAPYRPGECRLCWLFAHDDEYRRLLSGGAAGPATRVSGGKPRRSIDELAAARRRCGELKARGAPCPEATTVTWSYGVTTVPARRDDLLPRTLASLKVGGFDAPRLFADGCDDPRSWEAEFNLPVTGRHPPLRAWGNWVLALYELYVREPAADYYAVFQDDLVCPRNLRAYLERNPCPTGGYMNLYTYPHNIAVRPAAPFTGWYEGVLCSQHATKEPRWQRGLGALALVFTGAAVPLLLRHPSCVDRPKDPHQGHKKIDGGVVNVMNQLAIREYVHAPSLVQHTGQTSVIEQSHDRQPQAPDFPGEGFDALTLLPGAGAVLAPGVSGAGGGAGGVSSAGAAAERARILQAIADDEVRLRAAAGQAERRRYELLLADYRRRLAALPT
jgi:hypothetical protein